MTQQKAQKRAIRARMAKTGERYTAARHFHLNHHHPDISTPPDTAENGQHEPLAEFPPAELHALDADVPPEATPTIDPGFSDAAVLRATSRGWEEWLSLLDAWGATARSHAEIARHLSDAHAIDGWWAQSVTVGYERLRGMRAVHQGTDGFAVAASKTVPAPIERLRHMLVDEAARDTWLEPGTLRLRPSRSEKSARFDVLGSGEGTRLEAFLIAKGEAKATVQLQHVKLPSAEDVEPWRAFWKDRLNQLAVTLRQPDEHAESRQSHR